MDDRENGSGAEFDQESASAIKTELWSHLHVPTAVCMKEELQTDNLAMKEEPTFSPTDWSMQLPTSQYPIKKEDFDDDEDKIWEQTVVAKPFPLVLYKVNTSLHTTAQSEMETVQASNPQLQLDTPLVRSDKMDTTNENTEEKPYKCKLCQYSCARQSKMKEHERIHTGEKPYKCKACQCSFAYQSNLNRHERTHNAEKPYKCKLCQYSCSHQSFLEIHERTHTGDAPYKCKLCQYSCAYPSDLIEHVGTHTGEKPYECKLCQYRCVHPRNLKEHMKTHPGKKPYKCNVCQYTASQQINLKSHVRTHTGEKPYRCKLCQYTASQQSNLKRHERTHTGEKPYNTNSSYASIDVHVKMI